VAAGPATDGTLVMRADGSFVFAPAAKFVGTYTFTYLADDGIWPATSISMSVASNAATVTITVSNQPPDAVDDTAETNSNTPITIGVLANDTDPEQQALSVTTVTQGAHGTVGLDETGGANYAPATNFVGSDSFTYTISDGHGGTDTANVSITVRNQAPDAVGDTSQTNSNTPMTIAVLANDTDPELQPLIITAVTQGAHGTAATNANTVLYTPHADFVGTDSLTYAISDGHGGTDTATVSITVVNQLPNAVDDAETSNSGTPITIAVLANDTDPEHQPLSVTTVGQGAHGTVTINANATVRYTPNADFSGNDSFTYAIGDGHGGTDTATVSITVINQPPDAVNDAAESNGTPVIIAVLANDTDPEHQTLTVTAVGPGAHGTANLNPNGTVSYTPAAGYAGPDSLTYSISDGHGGTDTASVSIVVLSPNNAPGCGAVEATVITGGTIALNCSDADGDALTVTAATASLGSVTTNANGVVTYTAISPNVGTDTFTFTVGDGKATANGTAKIRVIYGFTNVLNLPAAGKTAFNRGSSVPLHWQWTNAAGVAVNTSAAAARVLAYACSTGGKLPLAYSVGGFTPLAPGSGNSFGFNTSANTWQFNWKLQYTSNGKILNLPAGTYVVQVRSDISGQVNPGTVQTCGTVQLTGALITVK
jgi:serine/threonine protein phosphatase PrpC